MFRTSGYFKPTVLTLALALALPALAADKLRIDKEADIPRFTYKVTDPLESVVRDKVLFAKVTAPVRADMESVLAKYDMLTKLAGMEPCSGSIATPAAPAAPKA